MPPEAIQVILHARPPTSRVVTGEATLNVPLLREDKVERVVLKCCGVSEADVRTHDTHANGTRVTTHHRDDRVLHQETRVVWQSSPPVAPASLSEKQREALSDTPATLSIPFTFYLPEGLPASCAKIDKYDVSAEIAYHIKCTAERPGWFKSNRRSQYRFQYLPPQPFSHKLREMMASGDWLGEWRFTHGSKAVKKNWLFGSEGSVKAGIQLPALDMYPLFTSIPVIVTVQTLSKLLDHEFVTVKEPLFPEPPASLADILLFVENQIQVRVPRHKDRASWRVADVPGFGTAVSQGKLHLQRAERVWVPDEADPSSGKGRWRQEVRATAQVRFDGPPTFETENFTFVNNLALQVPLTGRDLRVSVPLQLISGMEETGNSLPPPPQYEVA